MNERVKDFLASAIVGVLVGAVVAIAGGPLWAAFAFGYLTFLLVRTTTT